MSSTYSVIIITHNNERHIGKAMECLRQQTRAPDRIILVDSGSNNLSYLSPFASWSNVKIIYHPENIGFCRGNNLGMRETDPNDSFILFLNPYAFVTPTFLEEAIAYMKEPRHCSVGILTGALLGYDIDQDKPSGLYDSTGIFCRWYGRWYDRDQGQSIQQPPQREEEEPTAICGALMFCRKDALDQVLIRGNEVFDSSFYMYKDDIDLSLRVRRANWKLAFVPQFTAYHCRGWNPDRSKMARRFRKMSARNELCIHLRNYSPLKACYSLCKYLGVLFLDL